MTRKQKIMILFFISIPVFVVGYFLVSKQITTQLSLTNKTVIQEQSPQIKVKENEPKVSYNKQELEITDTDSEIDNASLSKTTSASFYASPYEFPHELYTKHITLAENGIPENQFYVHLALKQCDSAPLTYEELIEFQEKSPRSSMYLEKRFKKCEELAAILNKNTSYANRSFKELYDMWKEIAFENEYPLAVSSKIMWDNSNSYSDEEKRTALQNTIKLERYEGYSDVLIYYRVRAIKSRDVSNNHILAWGALTCDKNEACSISKYLKRYQMYISPSEYKKLNETFESIKDSIERKAWSELEIFKEPSPN